MISTKELLYKLSQEVRLFSAIWATTECQKVERPNEIKVKMTHYRGPVGTNPGWGEPKELIVKVYAICRNYPMYDQYGRLYGYIDKLYFFDNRGRLREIRGNDRVKIDYNVEF